MAASARNQTHYDLVYSDTKVYNKLHYNIRKVVFIWDLHTSGCLFVFIYCTFHLRDEEKNQKTEGVFQKMTRWVHMHFTKASDVPLNDFNEYWEAAEEEREKKIDSVFKKEKGLFSLPSLMRPVWQWLSFVKRTMLCCVPTATLRQRWGRNTSVALTAGLKTASLNWRDWAPFWLMTSWPRHRASHHRCIVFREKPAEQTPICLPNASWRLLRFSPHERFS